MKHIHSGLAIALLLLCMNGFAQQPGYRPRFSDNRTDSAGITPYWIFDHGKKVAIAGIWAMSLVRQYPDQTNVPASMLVDPPGFDFFTQQGSRVTIMNEDYQSNPIINSNRTKTFDLKDTTKYIVHFKWSLSSSEYATQDFTLAYDTTMKRYVITVDCAMTSNSPQQCEFQDFYVYGLGDIRPGIQKYNRIAFLDNNNQYKVHYPSVVCPGSLNNGELGSMSTTAPFIGLFNEPWGNPVLSFDSGSTRFTVPVCAAWFDLHLRWVPDAVSGPPYKYHSRYKTYWMNATESQALLAKSQTISQAASASRFDAHLPIKCGVVNSFEYRVDVNQPPFNNPYWRLSSNPSATWDATTAHTGSHSILYQKSATGTTIFPGTDGQEFSLAPGKTFKATAWVKTQNLTGGQGFWLEASFTYGGYNPAGWVTTQGPKYQSNKVNGTADWTKIQIPFPVTPQNQIVFLGQRITPVMDGQGKVWLDDLEFHEEGAATAINNSAAAPDVSATRQDQHPKTGLYIIYDIKGRRIGEFSVAQMRGRPLGRGIYVRYDIARSGGKRDQKYLCVSE